MEINAPEFTTLKEVEEFYKELNRPYMEELERRQQEHQLRGRGNFIDTEDHAEAMRPILEVRRAFWRDWRKLKGTKEAGRKRTAVIFAFLACSFLMLGGCTPEKAQDDPCDLVLTPGYAALQAKEEGYEGVEWLQEAHHLRRVQKEKCQAAQLRAARIREARKDLGL